MGIKPIIAYIKTYSELDPKLLTILFIAEILWLAAIATLYRVTARLDTASFWAAFLLTRPGIVFLCLMAENVMSLCVAALQLLVVPKRDYGRIGRTVLVNVVVFLGVLILGELAVRAFVTESLRGPAIAGVELRPYVWNEIRERFAKRAVEENQRNEQFHVFDPLLGWTIKPNSIGERGLFRSSAEGIRSPQAGIEYMNSHPSCRIALVGDSFVFSWESDFEKSWGHQLELILGNGCQVLNFGVQGYGVGQMFLRYKKDILPLRPDVVVVGFTDTVIFRTMGVYGALTFAPGYIPWPIPRYVLNEHHLRLLNVPLVRPEMIYSTSSIENLPYIRYAWNYEPSEWEMSGWQLLSKSYLFRMYVTLCPLWPVSRPEVSEAEVVTVNAALFKEMQAKIRANGAIPVLVYLPKQQDFHDLKFLPPVLKLLREHGLDYIDLTPCLNRVNAERRFLVTHYTAEGESAVAQCLGPNIRDYLNKAAGGNRNAMAGHTAPVSNIE